ncbi:Xylose isomerase domain protein TIM barrel [Fibrella aestuarina BUZ 2]|uniref:Xylose isomerase domain protein TIM barrel n=1 Tax=Fibrella aestuarina BUZ 2 TaxID=1166018 RepID=I0K6L8_9BACT|nr:sugar phosphate isomerase/epimerase family protein [Fibrella aestuarina]CCG99771.1 Xylose isomerase domain protein TIM barrel [Fibrella aestuarina BUZ 2]
MNQLGMNLFIWTMTMDEDLSDTLAFLADTGFDFVEMPVSTTPGAPPDLAKWQRLGQQAARLGLGVQTCSLLPPDLCLISPDAAKRRAGITYLKQVVDCSVAAGSRILMGPLFAGFKAFAGRPATADEWAWSVESMRAVAEHAQEQGVTLAIESLNRFETYLLTCAADTRRYIEAVDHPACRAAFDTFHANIEEKSLSEAIHTLAPYLVHVQLSENDRSTPGQGQVDFGKVLGTLADIDYEGPIAIEAFGPTPPELAAATHIFRPMFTSPEQLARDGYTFLQEVKKQEKEKRSFV